MARGKVRAPSSNDSDRTVHSVSSLTRDIKDLLEEEWPDVWVEGEISGFRPVSSGHWYFTLKDEGAQIQAVMFRTANRRISFPIHDGDAVLCRGRLSVYEPRGGYQLILEDLQPQGLGALQAAFHALRQRLLQEGLFATERKRPLPSLPRRVGIVTSPTGAALQDMLRILLQRDPTLQVFIAPTRVQGEGAATEIARALDLLSADGRAEVILCGRGGGSPMDLWAFNEEEVVRAIVRAQVPVISCVGHEVDFTLADLAADVRAPTPTAAAEMAVRQREEIEGILAELLARGRQAMGERIRRHRQELARLESRLISPSRRVEQGMLRLDELQGRLQGAMQRHLARNRERVEGGTRRLGLASPDRRVESLRRHLATLQSRLRQGMERPLGLARARLARQAGALHALSPLAVLERGFVVVFDQEGRAVRSAKELTAGQEVGLRFAEGGARARILPPGKRPSSE